MLTPTVFLPTVPTDQVADASGKLAYTSTLQTVTKIASTEGLLTLWNGFLPYYGRCGGHTVAMFVCVDQIRAFYRKLTA